MSKNYSLWGLAILGALLVAGTVFWNQDSDPRTTAGKDAEVSRGPSTDERNGIAPDERNGISPPPAVRHEAGNNLSTTLLSGALMEPPPGFQAVQPQPPSALVAAAQQGLGTETRSAADSAAPVELAIEASRDDTDPSLAALAIKAPREGAGAIPFASASREVEDPYQRQAPLEYGGSETALAPLPVEPSGLDSQDADTIAGPAEQARNDTEVPVETAVEAGGGDVGETPEDDGAIPAWAANGIEPAGKPLQSRLSADEDAAADPPGSRPDAIEEGHEQEPDDQLASRSVEFTPGTAPSGELETSEPEKQREAAHADMPPAVSRDTAMHIERLLDRLGFDPGPIDGVVGPTTAEAIVSFQKEHGRETTGEINDQLIAALESKLFESFQQYLERSRRQSTDSPESAPPEQPTQTAKRPPSGDRAGNRAGNRELEKSVKIYGERDPAIKAQSTVSSSDAPKSRARAERPAIRIETREEAGPIQHVRLQERAEKTEEKAPNAFEACAQSGKLSEYVKTESGFVLCEEFSFDAGIRR